MPELAKRVLAKLERERQAKAGYQGRPEPSPDPDLASRVLQMPFEEFQSAGATVEVKVPWDTEPIWFVSDETLAATLTREGVSRGRIWTANELLNLMAIPGITKEQAKKIATAKRIFEGTIEQ